MFVFGEKDFLRIAMEGKVVPLIYERGIDEETPPSAYLKLGKSVNSFLLESAGGSPNLTEYSFVGTAPLKVIKTRKSNPLSVLRDLVRTFAPGNFETPFPFWGGAVGYMRYDVCRYIER
ncbi:MAG: hypothetical protein WA148_02410, partial [Actinomycetota bacterium]